MEELINTVHKLQYLIGELGYECIVKNKNFKTQEFQKLLEVSIILNYFFYKIEDGELTE